MDDRHVIGEWYSWLNRDTNLTDGQKVVAGCLRERINWQRDNTRYLTAWPTAATLAEMSGRKPQSARKALQVLSKQGWIRKVGYVGPKRGSAAIYRPAIPEKIAHEVSLDAARVLMSVYRGVDERLHISNKVNLKEEPLSEPLNYGHSDHVSAGKTATPFSLSLLSNEQRKNLAHTYATKMEKVQKWAHFGDLVTAISEKTQGQRRADWQPFILDVCKKLEADEGWQGNGDPVDDVGQAVDDVCGQYRDMGVDPTEVFTNKWQGAPLKGRGAYRTALEQLLAMGGTFTDVTDFVQTPQNLGATTAETIEHYQRFIASR